MFSILTNKKKSYYKNICIIFILQKCLNTVDLTSLGVGSCLGTGMYVVTGLVARRFAGPAVILSFIIAAVASLFSGMIT